MPILTVLLAFAGIAQAQDSWTLKAPMETSTKLSWDVAVDASMNSEEHHASFVLGRLIKPQKDAAKPLVATFTWDDLKVDDQDGQEIPPMDEVIGTSGEVLKAIDPTDDAYRVMLSPFVFVYPSKPVAVGDHWTAAVKPSGGGPMFTYDYTVKQTDIVHLAKPNEPANDVSALVVSAKITTNLKDGVTGEGAWWLSRTGRVVKFEIKLKGWSVPVAGPESFDASIRGIAH